MHELNNEGSLLHTHHIYKRPKLLRHLQCFTSSQNGNSTIIATAICVWAVISNTGAHLGVGEAAVLDLEGRDDLVEGVHTAGVDQEVQEAESVLREAAVLGNGGEHALLLLIGDDGVCEGVLQGHVVLIGRPTVGQ